MSDEVPSLPDGEPATTGSAGAILGACNACQGAGRWLTPGWGVRPCPCCEGAGATANPGPCAVAVCIACAGRGAVGNDEAVVCPSCRGFGGAPLRNPAVAVGVDPEDVAA